MPGDVAFCQNYTRTQACLGVWLWGPVRAEKENSSVAVVASGASGTGLVTGICPRLGCGSCR